MKMDVLARSRGPEGVIVGVERQQLVLSSLFQIDGVYSCILFLFETAVHARSSPNAL